MASIEVNLEHYLDELSTDQLRGELRRRDVDFIESIATAFFQEFRDYLDQGNISAAKLLLDRLEHPKFRDQGEALEARASA